MCVHVMSKVSDYVSELRPPTGGMIYEYGVLVE
jgi:hypothetical protein